MHFVRKSGFACGLAALGVLALAPAQAQRPGSGPIKRVLLISVDGLHAVDLANYTRNINPGGALAGLSAHGATYTQAFCSKPSDSFPGLMALVTGGTPVSTGVWYDDSWDRSLYASIADAGAPLPANPGAEVVYDETIDLDSSLINGGGGIDATHLPRRADNTPVYPHSFLRVNTIFNVIKQAGLRTAWADKHLSYEIVNGPTGPNLDDLYLPEINAPIVPLNNFGDGPTALAGATTPTDALAAVETYDNVKVNAILNEIDGKDHAGNPVGAVPALFGMNFQAVSVGQKLQKDKIDARRGGYTDNGISPSPLLTDALNYVDNRIGKFVAELNARGLANSTMIIVTAKHGQSPTDINNLLKIGQSNLDNVLGSNIAFDKTDDISLLWLNNPAQTAADVAALRAANGPAATGTNFNTPVAQNLGIEELLSGESLTLMFNAPGVGPGLDPRTPDIIVKPRMGVIYTGSSKKISEHGGFTTNDTNVALLVSSPLFTGAMVIKTPVQTTQVAPTILTLLNINPLQLQAVRREKTPTLPGLPLDSR